jgi:hypothetical protein
MGAARHDRHDAVGEPDSDRGRATSALDVTGSSRSCHPRRWCRAGHGADLHQHDLAGVLLLRPRSGHVCRRIVEELAARDLDRSPAPYTRAPGLPAAHRGGPAPAAHAGARDAGWPDERALGGGRPPRALAPFTRVRGVGFAVAPCESFGLVGESGSGKSTVCAPSAAGAGERGAVRLKVVRTRARGVPAPGADGVSDPYASSTRATRWTAAVRALAIQPPGQPLRRVERALRRGLGRASLPLPQLSAARQRWPSRAP